MTIDDAPATSRRALRQQTEGAADSGPLALSAEPLTPAPPAHLPEPEPHGRKGRDAAAHRVAFGWVDEASVLAPQPVSVLDAGPGSFEPVTADLLSDAPHRSPWRPGVLVPIALIALLIAVYAGTTLLWPLYAVAPKVGALAVQPIAAPAAAPAWPAAGSAAIEVAGIGTLASTGDPDAMASITKVVTALLVLDQMPLAVGEQGPEFRFTYSDRAHYWNLLENDESALDVPVGGTLSEYQLLEGMLIGSAGNYAERLAGNLWPSDAVFADAARTWLSAHGVPGITIVDPTGIESGNTASPASLITLAEHALANPVIAEIVAKPSVELPGAGVVQNTNALLADAGVLGIKTGSLDRFNLLSAKQVTVGQTTVRLYASVLGQPTGDDRFAASRALYAQLEQELQLRPSVTAGTVAGVVTTRWGERIDIVTAQDADVILWNGGTGTVATTYALGDHRTSGDTVGSLTVTGPLDTTEVPLRLAADVEPPSAWWRLTHPLDLFGLND